MDSHPLRTHRPQPNGQSAIVVWLLLALLLPGCWQYRAVVTREQWTTGATAHIASGEYEVAVSPASKKNPEFRAFKIRLPLIEGAEEPRPAEQVTVTVANADPTDVEMAVPPTDSSARRPTLLTRRKPPEGNGQLQLTVCALLRTPEAQTKVRVAVSEDSRDFEPEPINRDDTSEACETGGQSCRAWFVDIGMRPAKVDQRTAEVTISDGIGYGVYRLILTPMQRSNDAVGWKAVGLSKSELRIVQSNPYLSFGAGIAAAAAVMVGLAVLAGQ